MSNPWSPWWQLGLAVVSILVFFIAIRRCRCGHFYADTPSLFWMGIFVWGDALVLAPFWLLASLLFLVITPLMSLRAVLIFFVIRAAFEVIYWLGHQMTLKEYQPPLFRRVRWLNAQEAAILYQLLNMCQVILGLVWLSLTWT